VTDTYLDGLPPLPEPWTAASTLKCTACGAAYEPSRALAPIAANSLFGAMSSGACKCGSQQFSGTFGYDSPSPAKYTADQMNAHYLAGYEAGRASRAQTPETTLESFKAEIRAINSLDASQTPGDKPTAPQGVVGEASDSVLLKFLLEHCMVEDEYGALAIRWSSSREPRTHPMPERLEWIKGDLESEAKKVGLTSHPAPSAAQHQEVAGYRHWWRMSPGTQVAVVSGLADPGATDPYGGTSGIFERTEPLGVLQAQHQLSQQGESA
jgi:hypothetical protein